MLLQERSLTTVAPEGCSPKIFLFIHHSPPPSRLLLAVRYCFQARHVVVRGLSQSFTSVLLYMQKSGPLECLPVDETTRRCLVEETDPTTGIFPTITSRNVASRAFSSSSPLSWNALPPQLRDTAISISIFRQSLKTHLFNNNSD